jgi:3-hydroxyacyl-[acyl-carrier-protein] dehydratase
MSIFGSKNTIKLDIKEICDLLPHRYPFLLVDKITSLDAQNGKIVGLKNVTMNEPFFQGHFPSRPIMPGVLIVEAMAQVSGICALTKDASLAGNLFYFTSIESAKFRIPVVPGNTLIMKANLLKSRGTISKFACEAFVEDNLVAEATLTAQVITEEK